VTILPLFGIQRKLLLPKKVVLNLKNGGVLDLTLKRWLLKLGAQPLVVII
jgi:hypothetical protein